MTDKTVHLLSKIERNRQYEARRTGRQLRVPCGPSLQRRNLLRSRGMSDTEIAAACDLHQTTITGLGKRPAVAAVTEAAIFSVPVPHEFNPSDGMRVDKTGTRRRICALVTLGFTQAFIARRIGADPDVVVRLTREGPHQGKANRYVTGAMFKAVRDVYGELAFKDPAALGAMPHEITRAKHRAASLNWAPPHCWDDDTIDDPAAHPEWTGACGTDAGARIHRREAIQICEPCQAAWLEYRRGEKDRLAARKEAA